MLDKRASIIDCALSESGLLSSATDNMKELILPKIQATATFVDIYTSMLSIGVRFSDISKIMTSDAFTELTRLVSSNIFDATTSSYSLKRAIDFFVDLKPLPRVKRDLIKRIFTNGDEKTRIVSSMSDTEVDGSSE